MTELDNLILAQLGNSLGVKTQLRQYLFGVFAIERRSTLNLWGCACKGNWCRENGDFLGQAGVVHPLNDVGGSNSFILQNLAWRIYAPRWNAGPL